MHGDDQIRMLFDQMRGLKDSHDDMAFTPPLLATIAARTLIVHGDRDPLYPVELALEMYRAIPSSALWVVPNGGHGPIFGALAAPFVTAALTHLNNPILVAAVSCGDDRSQTAPCDKQPDRLR